MPVYEYACKACDQHFEVAQSFTDEPLTTCPNCGGAVRKVFGSVGIMFKGSGFYRTDSRIPTGKKDKKDKAEAGAASTASSSTDGAGSGSGSSDSSSGTAGSGSGDKAKSSGDAPAKPAAKSA